MINRVSGWVPLNQFITNVTCLSQPKKYSHSSGHGCESKPTMVMVAKQYKRTLLNMFCGVCVTPCIVTFVCVRHSVVGIVCPQRGLAQNTRASATSVFHEPLCSQHLWCHLGRHLDAVKVKIHRDWRDKRSVYMNQVAIDRTCRCMRDCARCTIARNETCAANARA